MAHESRASGEPSWAEVETYLEHALLPSDPSLAAAIDAGNAAGLPAWQVSPLQGRFLHLLARATRATHVLEVGTLAGYSTIWLARALPPDGRLVTLEVDAHHAAVARTNLGRAGLLDRVEVREGPAIESMRTLEGEHRPPFDLVFIDADKPNNPAYFDGALRLTHPGSLIVVDNVVRQGRVARSDDADPSVRGTRELLDRVGRNPRVIATALPTVGAKGYDGMLLVLVTGRDPPPSSHRVSTEPSREGGRPRRPPSAGPTRVTVRGRRPGP